MGTGAYCIEFERSAVSPYHVSCKLGPWRMAAAGRPLPLLMVCETVGGNFRAVAGTLPMLTATLERERASPLTGPPCTLAVIGSTWPEPGTREFLKYPRIMVAFPAHEPAPPGRWY